MLNAIYFCINLPETNKKLKSNLFDKISYIALKQLVVTKINENLGG